MTNDKTEIKVLISGGGTGGHIFPAVSIANALRRHDPSTKILFVGAENRMEMERVPAAGYEIVGLPVAGFDRKRLWRNVPVLFKLAKSMMRARKILKRFKPDIAVGVGGYASGPMLKAAQRAGIPTLIQEQNSYAGVTNKLLAKNAKAICVAYEGMERFFPADKIKITGNPVRADIVNAKIEKSEARRALGLPADKPVVLVVGGSLGARTINESVAAALDKLSEAGIFVMWQTGKLYAEECEKIAARYPDSVKAQPFISNMDVAYRAADLVVSRAGAGTISEIQLVGMPSILVPSPNVAEDHQRKNALALSDRGAAIMVLDSEAREKLGDAIISTVNDKEKLDTLARNASSMALRDADQKIIETIYGILKTDC